MLERFLGTWELDPSQSAYEFGAPPQQGKLTFHFDGSELAYDMEWVMPQGQPMNLTIHALPDGQVYPYGDNPAVADAVRYTVIDEFTLDSEALKQGRVVALGRRVISPDGQTMAITQSGHTPDGKPYDNRSLYRRLHKPA